MVHMTWIDWTILITCWVYLTIVGVNLFTERPRVHRTPPNPGHRRTERCALYGCDER